jgi:hypothetical protein
MYLWWVPTGKTLKEQLPEVLNSAIYMPWGKWGEIPFYYDAANGEQSLYLDYAYCDESLNDIFTFRFLNGDATNPLANPESAIITQSLAKQLCGKYGPGREATQVSNLILHHKRCFCRPARKFRFPVPGSFCVFHRKPGRI